MLHHRIIHVLVGMALLFATLMPQAAQAAGLPGGPALAPIDPGLSLLKDSNPGTGDGILRYNYSEAVSLGSKVFFFADDGVHGLEPWITDGTSAGTSMIKDTYPNGNGADIDSGGYTSQPVAWNGKIFYRGFGPGPDGTAVPQLWVSDGTPAGTHAVTNAYHPIEELKAGTRGVMFRDRVIGTLESIWWTDGTVQKTFEVYHHDGYESSASYIEYQGAAYYIDLNQEMWKVDLNTRQTSQVNHSYNINKKLIAVSNGLLFLTRQAIPYNDGDKLWQMDGTTQGFTQINQDGEFEASYLTTASTLFFSIYYSLSGTRLLYATSVAAGGMVRLTSEDNPLAGYLYNVAGVAYYTRGLYAQPSKIWRSDGTPAGTWQICPSCLHSRAAGFAPLGGKIIYTAVDGMGDNLWITDGSDDGTHRLADLTPGPQGAYLSNPVSTNGYVFFTADDGVHGLEPWVYRPGTNRLVTHRDGAETGMNQTVSIDVAGYDQQLDGLPFSILDIDATSLKGGTVTRDDRGTPDPRDDRAFYTPPARYTGLDEFAYTIGDATGAVTTGRVTVNVVYSNRAPTGISLAYRNGDLPLENAPAGTVVGTLVVTDPDPNDTHTCTLTSNAPFAMDGLTLLTTLPLNYEAQPSYTFSVTCTDAGGLSVSKGLTVGVGDLNEPPVMPAGQSATVIEDRSQTFTILWSDPENNQSQMTVFQPPSHGIVTISDCSPSGCMAHYTPAADYVGADSFILKATDIGGAFSTQTVSITVLPGNDDPPVMIQPPDLVLPQTAASYQRVLYGIAAGPYEEGPVTITAKASDETAVTDLAVNYTGGSVGSLNFTFHPEVAETATITLTLDDGVNQADYTFTLRAADVRPVWLPLIGR